MFESVSSLKIVGLPHFIEDNGDLVVIEGCVNIPFDIARVFVVRAPDGAVRGQHAHRKCSQFLTSPSGTIEVVCDDGRQTAEFVLSHRNVGLLVPAGIWSKQTYRGPQATLTVLCDRRYEAADYIRDYGSFLDFRAERGG